MYALPSLHLHALPSLHLQCKQLDELNAHCNSAVRHEEYLITSVESVKEVLQGLGRLIVKHLLLLVKFYKRMWEKRDFKIIFSLHIHWIIKNSLYSCHCMMQHRMYMISGMYVINLGCMFLLDN